MKITLDWLKEYVEFDLSATELADKLDLSGTEVESIEYLGSGFEQVVVGQVISAEAHPNADRLKVCEVDLGGETATIVCGAPNVAAGQKVPVARPGATLPSGIKIKEAKIRGVESAGMICSEVELGLADESPGIMVLPEDAAPGEPVGRLLGVDDWMLELEITPNRPDCMAMIGMAREVAALLGTSIKRPTPNVVEHSETARAKISVKIEDEDLCPRYSARYIDNVSIGPSPPWLRQRLAAVGVRPINNVVDVTNYVLIETGQPLHAFDNKLLSDGSIVVRRARPGEKLETIDHVERELEPDNLVISDGTRAVALAGVMGGLNSEISDDTTEILIESANFFAPNIRKSSRAMGLISESSLRFERGVDISGTAYAADRAAELIAAVAGGRVWNGVVDEYARPQSPRRIDLRPRRVNDMLGTELDEKTMGSILARLELEVEADAATQKLIVAVPTFRVDLEREIDLIEEIARIHGLNNIPSRVLPSSSEDRGLTATQKNIRRLRRLMVAQGLAEVINFSFFGRQELDLLDLPSGHAWLGATKVNNPFSEDQALLRTTLIPSILRSVSHNYNREQADLRLFEIGNVFRGEGTVPEESLMLAGALTGQLRAKSWHEEPAEVSLYDLRGIFETICAKMPLLDCHIRGADHSILSPGQGAELVAGNSVIAIFGTLHPRIQQKLGLRQPVQIFEATIEKLVAQTQENPGFSEIPKFPPVVLDLAFIVDEKISWHAVEHLVIETGAPLLKAVKLFDLYRGTGVPDGRKSLAFNLTFQAGDRTLTDNEVGRVQAKIVKRAARELGADLRD